MSESDNNFSSHHTPPVRGVFGGDPKDAPNRNIYLVREFPPRPEGMQTNGLLEGDMGMGIGDEPQETIHVGAVEWQWSPMHSRTDNYYLSSSEQGWKLFNAIFDDYEVEWIWVELCSCRRIDTDDRTVACWLLHDALKDDPHEIDPFHYIASEGLLSVADFNHISDLVWDIPLEDEDDDQEEL